MEASNFVDYYELLEISPNANSGTIERMFRYFAQRYHPDNQDTGDRPRFDAIMTAYDALNDPGKRAQYDVKHKAQSGLRWKLLKEASDNKGFEQDVDLQNKLLSIFYVRRRQNIANPGIGDMALERLLGCPAEHLQFHLWYLKEKGWIRKTESGMFAITVEGVDRANSDHGQVIANRLLTDQTMLGHAAE
ncbi:MAG TPA: DnaJ domain-containing protein [Xanthobacteraceae bacterium]|jgi:curved DNA-binding protein CbpA